MRKHECSEERFLKDVASHTMTILRDDGVNRHLRFRKPGSGSYWFDLITWPGALCIDGDCGTYVFRRIEDMFQFFRTDRTYMTRNGNKLAINPGYWGEKLVSLGKNEGFSEFDSEAFDEVIMERLVNWIRDNRDRTTKDERRDLWDEVVSRVIDEDSNGDRKQIAAYDFSHRLNSKAKFSFQDLWESNFNRYTFHFIWCCYAIAYGVLQYDNTKE